MSAPDVFRVPLAAPRTGMSEEEEEAAMEAVELLRTLVARGAFSHSATRALDGFWPSLRLIVVDASSHLAKWREDTARAASEVLALVLRFAGSLTVPPESHQRGLVLYFDPSAAWDAAAAAVTAVIRALVVRSAAQLGVMLSARHGITLVNASVEGRRVRHILFGLGGEVAVNWGPPLGPRGTPWTQFTAGIVPLIHQVYHHHTPPVAAPGQALLPAERLSVYIDLAGASHSTVLNVLATLGIAIEGKLWRADRCVVAVGMGPHLVVNATALLAALKENIVSVRRAAGCVRDRDPCAGIVFAHFWATWRALRTAPALSNTTALMRSPRCASGVISGMGRGQPRVLALWQHLAAGGYSTGPLQFERLPYGAEQRTENFLDPNVADVARHLADFYLDRPARASPSPPHGFRLVDHGALPSASATALGSSDAATSYAQRAPSGSPPYTVFEQQALRAWWMLNELALGWRWPDCDWRVEGRDGVIERTHLFATRKRALPLRSQLEAISGDGLKRSVDELLRPGLSPTSDEGPGEGAAGVDSPHRKRARTGAV